MKCVKCGSADDVKVVEDSAIEMSAQCGICGRSFTISKLSVGKNHDLFFYVDLLREKLCQKGYVIVEARGDLIPKMLIIVCNIVDKGELANIESVDVLCNRDAKNKEVATERVLAKRRD